MPAAQLRVGACTFAVSARAGREQCARPGCVGLGFTKAIAIVPSLRLRRNVQINVPNLVVHPGEEGVADRRLLLLLPVTRRTDPGFNVIAHKRGACISSAIVQEGAAEMEGGAGSRSWRTVRWRCRVVRGDAGYGTGAERCRISQQRGAHARRSTGGAHN